MPQSKRKSRPPSREERPAQRAYDVVRACLSRAPAPVRRERVVSFIEEDGEWSDLGREAARHRVWLLLFRRLEALLGERLPPALQNEIRERRQRMRIHATFLARELGRISEAFEDRGLPLLSLKGPVLAHVAYGDIATRRYVDLDVLVPGARFEEADRLLREMGYSDPPGKTGLMGWRRRAARLLAGQWPYVQAQGAFVVDLHSRLLPPSFSFPVAFEAFWDRSVPVELSDGVTARRFSREDMILILAYHGLKNQWRALKHITDLAGLICSEPGPDWDVLIRRARETKATRVLALGLSLARDLLATPLPPEIQNWVQQKSVEETTSLMAEYLRNRDDPSRSTFGQQVESMWHRADTQLQLEMKDTVMGQVRHLAYAIVHVFWSAIFKP